MPPHRHRKAAEPVSDWTTAIQAHMSEENRQACQRPAGYQTVAEIAREMGKGRSTVQRLVRILFDQGRVEYTDAKMPMINGVLKTVRLYRLKKPCPQK